MAWEQSIVLPDLRCASAAGPKTCAASLAIATPVETCCGRFLEPAVDLDHGDLAGLQGDVRGAAAGSPGEEDVDLVDRKGVGGERPEVAHRGFPSSGSQRSGRATSAALASMVISDSSINMPSPPPETALR